VKRVVSGSAPAKLNLHLAVLGKRADGFHELDTVMVGIGLADRLELSVAPGAGVSCSVGGPAGSADVPTDERNLAVGALLAGLARAEELGIAVPNGLELRLDKHVPSQAGLGGGSSDAATALHLLEELLECDLGASWRSEWLASVGSDTVFFDAARPSLHGRCRGRGERVERLAGLPKGWCAVLVTPDLRAATGPVFGALGAPRSAALSDPADFAALEPAAARAALSNDLEQAALAAIPGLESWSAGLEQLDGRRFCLSGSGSSFFALCADAAEAEPLAAKARSAFPQARLIWHGPFA
jgi:4-diphosphocytidyl-2-C-methyl-D-erythritol kinase